MARWGSPRSLRRRFVTPEGIDLRLELGSAGARAAAFALDLAIQFALLIALTIAVGELIGTRGDDVLAMIWLLGFFTLRNGWFILWELGPRGATPGKRVSGLRVVARDGARLTGGAVVARNAMREVEVFLPLTLLGAAAAREKADAAMAIAAFCWSGIFLFFPLFNRDRLRVGDLLAGTWVVRAARTRLGSDLVAARAPSSVPTRQFSEAALSLYGEYELQALEDVLRENRPEAVRVVADTIRVKAGLDDDYDDYGFLQDYYAALCVRLERGMLMGRRRADKFASARR